MTVLVQMKLNQVTTAADQLKADLMNPESPVYKALFAATLSAVSQRHAVEHFIQGMILQEIRTEEARRFNQVVKHRKEEEQQLLQVERHLDTAVKDCLMIGLGQLSQKGVLEQILTNCIQQWAKLQASMALDMTYQVTQQLKKQGIDVTQGQKIALQQALRMPSPQDFWRINPALKEKLDEAKAANDSSTQVDEIINTMVNNIPLNLMFKVVGILESQYDNQSNELLEEFSGSPIKVQRAMKKYDKLGIGAILQKMSHTEMFKIALIQEVYSPEERVKNMVSLLNVVKAELSKAASDENMPTRGEPIRRMNPYQPFSTKLSK